MSKGIGSTRAVGLLAAAVATTALATASSAGAATVDMVRNPHSSHSLIGIGHWAFGERNDITVKPSGRIRQSGGVLDPKFPFVPTSVVVTDRATPLSPGLGNCLQLNPNSVWCPAPLGIDTVEADLGDSLEGSSFELVPGSSGYQTPMLYDLNTRDGPDHVKIPISRGTTLWTNGGNDTVDLSDPSGVWGETIRLGAGDDDIRLTTDAAGSLDCNDGVDTARVVGPNMFVQNCETLTVGP